MEEERRISGNAALQELPRDRTEQAINSMVNVGLDVVRASQFEDVILEAVNRNTERIEEFLYTAVGNMFSAMQLDADNQLA